MFRTNLSGHSIEEAAVVAGLQIAGDDAAGILRQIQCKYLLRDVVVVEFVVAQGNVNVQRGVVLPL